MTDATPWKEALGGLLAPGDLIAEKYRVDRLLRGGGVGVVVEAFHLQLEERVAIKFLRPKMADNEEAVARFEREARAAFKIRSEHVARVIDVGRHKERLPYIVMEYLDGLDLADVLAERGRVSIAEAVSLGVQLCAALEAAHSIGIIHRDIKPENLFITRQTNGQECLKVLDFGLSKVLAAALGQDSKRSSRVLTMAGRALGTPQYMSPEQWMSASEADERADIWAAGIIIYELVAGTTPFRSTIPAQLCRMVVRDEAMPLRQRVTGVPEGLDEVVMRCLCKAPEERFASAQDLMAALLPFATRQSSPSPLSATGPLSASGPLSSSGPLSISGPLSTSASRQSARPTARQSARPDARSSDPGPPLPLHSAEVFASHVPGISPQQRGTEAMLPLVDEPTPGDIEPPKMRVVEPPAPNQKSTIQLDDVQKTALKQYAKGMLEKRSTVVMSSADIERYQQADGASAYPAPDEAIPSSGVVASSGAVSGVRPVRPPLVVEAVADPAADEAERARARIAWVVAVVLVCAAIGAGLMLLQRLRSGAALVRDQTLARADVHAARELTQIHQWSR